MDLLQSLAGLLVGMVVGLTGVGGGSLMTPLLVLLFGFAPATAVGTDLLYASATKVAGTVGHSWRGNVDWRIAAWLGAGSVPASLATTFFLSTVKNPQALNVTLTFALGIMLLLTAVALVYRRRLQQVGDRVHAVPWFARNLTPITVAFGVFLGVMVTLSSVGAGAVGVSVLFFLYPGFKPVRIVGTDIAHAVPLTLAAGLGHLWLGNVNWVLLVSLLAGSVPGVMLGSQIASKLPDNVIRFSLIALLVVVGGRLVLR